MFLNITLTVALGAQLLAQNGTCGNGPEEGGQGGGGGSEPGSGGTSINIPRLHAVDPNLISGPTGYNPAQWVARKDRLGYTVYFENDPDFATGPAQVVKINLPVDPQLNINSMRLGNFGFGSFSFDVPPNTSFYYQRLDVRDSLSVYVDFTAGIDVVKKEVFWIFESIDPATGFPPDDGNVGFLPVNDTTVNIYNDTLPKRGEGYVTFTIVPTSSALTGDTASAKASIVFDINAPLETNTWINLIDAFPPVSALNALPDTLPPGDSLTLTWTGTDDPGGVGVDFYDLYAAKDGGPFLIVAEKIDTTVYTFAGTPGSTYAFYTRATDYVGNVENPKFAGEQTVLFQADLDSVTVLAKVFLQGPYVPAVNLMHDSLRVQNRLPLTEPYTGLTGFTHTGGGGGEQTTPAVLSVSGPDAVVDWVFLELRSAANPAQVLATRSALVQRDGDVVDVDGVSPVRFAPGVDAANYSLAVRHRNHLGVQTGAPKLYPLGTAVGSDFSSLLPEGFYAHNGLNPAQKTVSGVFTLWAGNGRTDVQLKYNGSNNDRNAILLIVGLATPNAIVPGYLLADYNLDGVVKYNGSGNDRNVLLGNVGIATPSAVVEEQVAR